MFAEMKKRAYFSRFMPLVEQVDVRRAVVLMGPRRVGKTVMIHQAIQQLLDSGVEPSRISYVSMDSPLYNRLSLEEMLELVRDAAPAGEPGPQFLFADEIQYLRDWEVHLKSLVDTYPNIKLIVSGSAAAALRLKSIESGAGRFTDFLLPPLTFHEFLRLQDLDHLVEVSVPEDGPEAYSVPDLGKLNERFLDYLNYGGYPEALFSEVIQQDLGRFIRADIIEKVLLRDLPSLYGVTDVQELNALFTALAFNTANEVSLDALSQNSGVAKPTIKRYMEYLEAAFLIKRVHRIDRNARHFRRANFFKVYLTNPSMRSALFSSIEADDQEMGQLAETAVFSQWFHAAYSLHYARWRTGEVDIVCLDDAQRPNWCVEVKWSDAHVDREAELSSLASFCRVHPNVAASATTRTRWEKRILNNGMKVSLFPVSLYCYLVGRNTVENKDWRGWLVVN